MKRTIAVMLALSAALLLVVIGVTRAQVAADGTASGRAAPAPSSSVISARPLPGTTTTASDGVPSIGALAALSPRQLAGQRVIYGYRGLTPPASLLRRVRTGEVAGVVFFSSNYASRAQMRAAAAMLQRAAAQSPVKLPLLLMVDQEGGAVRRLPGAPVRSEKQIGASADPVLSARQAGRGAGLNLKSVGMNVDLAPVLDVFRVPGNFIDRFGRSYGSDPRLVARVGAAFIDALQRTGVAATAKHFPGLGAATREQNTDEVPVTLRVPLSRLRSLDEAPYSAAIAAQVRLVMLSWAVYPALDRERPAGFSPLVVRRELRERLRFTGVTITDSLAAGALRAWGRTTSPRAVFAARAGMDLMLCGTMAGGDDATDGLTAALKSGALGRREFLASVERIVALRASLAK